jgi:hypothetical protein
MTARRSDLDAILATLKQEDPGTQPQQIASALKIRKQLQIQAVFACTRTRALTRAPAG